MSNRDQFLSTVQNVLNSSGTIQIVNPSKDVTVTYKCQKKTNKYLVFVTNYFKNNLPISSYLDLDDIQAIISPIEVKRCCIQAMNDSGWKFHFWS